MSEYTFLEAALNAEGANTLREENAALVDYATVVTDQLVAEEHEFVSSHLGQFIVQGDIDETYEQAQNPVGDVVVESIAFFSDVISSADLTVEEKQNYMQAGAFLIGAEQDAMGLLSDDSVVTESVVDSFATAAGHMWRKVTDTETLMDKGVDVKDNAMDMVKKIWEAIMSYMDSLMSQISDMSSDVQEWFKSAYHMFDNVTLWTSHPTLHKLFGTDLVKLVPGSDLPKPIQDAMQTVADKLQEVSGGHLTDSGSVLVASLLMAALALLVVVGLATLVWKNGGKKLAVAIIAKVKGFFGSLGKTRKAVVA